MPKALQKDQQELCDKLVKSRTAEELQDLLTKTSNDTQQKIDAAKQELAIVRKAYDRKVAEATLKKRFKGMSAEEKALLQELGTDGIESGEAVGTVGAEEQPME